MRRVDGRLDLFLSHVQRQRQAELQHDDRGGPGTGRGHLAQTLHLAELPLQGSGDRGGHDLRAGSRIESDHLNRGIAYFRQRRNRQLRVGYDPRKHDGGHQQRSRYWAKNKWAGRAHGSFPRLLLEGRIVVLEMITLDPSSSFSKPLLATTSPA